MEHFRTRICNRTPESMTLHVEPWGYQVPLRPGAACVVDFESEKHGEAEISVEEGNVLVYGWEGCLVRFDVEE